MSRKPTPILERFWSKVDKSNGPLGCWLWTGGKQTSEHGVIFYSKTGRYLAHRFCFKLMYGDMINEKPCVCHKCDNPSCVNPLHLFLGTITDNNNDRQKKGRTPKGSKCGASKLNENDVLEIRKLLSLGVNRKEICKKFNIINSTISSIKTKQNWRWL